MRRSPFTLGPVALFTLLLALLLPPAAAWASLSYTWSSPVSDLSTGSGASAPQIASSGDTMVAVWQQGAIGGTNINVARSTDGGATWSPVTTPWSTNAQYRSPRVAVSGSTVIVTWSGNQNGFAYISRSTDGGEHFSAASGITTSTNFASEPIEVALDGSNAVVAWRVVGAGSNSGIDTRSSNDAGATWGTPATVAPATSENGNVRLAISGSNAMAVYTAHPVNDDVIEARGSTDGGATWNAPTTLSITNSTAANPQVALSGTTALVTWQIDLLPETIVQARRTSDLGATWDPGNDLSDSIGTFTVPQVAFDGTNAVVVWQAINDIQAISSPDGGVTWAGTWVTISGTGNDTAPQVALNGQTAVATWLNGGNVVNSTVSTDAGATWGPAVLQVSDSGLVTPGIPLVAMSNNNAASVWANNGVVQSSYLEGVTVASSSSSSAQQPAHALFTYWLEDGQQCSMMSPQDQVVGTFAHLPGADAPCGYDDSVVTGWRIPGQDAALEPGRRVLVVASQQFTAVLEMPKVKVLLDANVAANDACLAADGTDVPLPARTSVQSILRADVTSQTLPSAAACTPAGVKLAGWTDRRGVEDISTAPVLAPGAKVPAPWVDSDGNAANVIHLYATWVPAK